MSAIPTWDLTTLYSGLDSPAFTGALDSVEAALDYLEEQAACGEDLPALLGELNRTALALSGPEVYLSLRGMTEPMSADLSRHSIRAGVLKDRQRRLWDTLLQSLVSRPDAGELLASCQPLAPYRYAVQEYRRLTPHRPSPEQQTVVQAMRRNGGQGWYALRCQLDAAAAAPLREGEPPLPLAKLRGLAASPDGEIRRLAYEAEMTLYPTYAVPMAACLSGIKGEALEELSWKGYASVWEEMEDVNRISGETLESMFDAIADHLPHFRRYLRRKADLLGRRNGLPWYDLLAPVEGIPAGFSFDTARNMLSTALHSFSPDLGELADRALTSRWLDALPASGKQGGAVCIDLPQRRESRILTNYTGTFRCIRTIAHELGHAYHARCLDGIPLLLRDAPTPICETASLMNEVIFLNKTLEQMPAGQQFALLESDLQESAQTVLDIYSRYLFEREVFARRSSHALLPDELCRIMEDVQRQVFGGALDGSCLHPYMWMCKVHYYIPEFHYYNYPYIAGLLLAKGLYARYLAQPTGFPQAYRRLLSATCDHSMEDIAAQAGVDIRDRGFWDEALDLIAGEIDRWLRLADRQDHSDA